MSFLNPIFLFALLTVAVPLLIYLLNIRKPKRVQFSTLAFFEALKSSALKRIKLKRWLLLAVRILSIVMLVIAASRPFLPPNLGWSVQNEPKIIGLLIDNSPGMDQIDQNGPYFEQAIAIARTIAETGDNETRFIIEVTNGESLNLPPVAKNAALRHLSSLETVNGGNYTFQRTERLKAMLNEENEANKFLYLMSDGQQSQFQKFDQEEPVSEPEEGIYFQAFTLGNAQSANIGFHEVTLERTLASSEARYQVRTIIQNFGSTPVANAFVSLYVEDEMISQQSLNADAGSTEEMIFDIPGSNVDSFIPVMLEIEGDELSYDNQYRAVIQQPLERNVLVIGEQEMDAEFSSLLQPLLLAASEETGRFNADFTTADDLNPTEVTEYDAIIFDGLSNIPDYVIQPVMEHIQTGAGLFLLPAADGNINSYNRFLQQAGAGFYSNVMGSYGSFEPIDRVAAPEAGNPVLDVIFEDDEQTEIRINVPEIFYYYNIQTENTAIPVLSNRSGNALFAETRVGNGRLIFSAIGTDPGWSNFSVKPFFAPFFFRMVDYLMLGEGVQLQTHTLGEEFRMQADQSQHDLAIDYEGETIVPQISQSFSGASVYYPATEWVPGWFSLVNQNEEKVFMAGVNQDTMESDVSALSTIELRNILGKYFKNIEIIEAEGVQELQQQEFQTAAFGKEIWYWFITIAFILLIVESLISRHYKAESIG